MHRPEGRACGGEQPCHGRPGSLDGGGIPLRKELDVLRDEVARIDGQIIDLVRDRLRTVERIGQVKSELGVPVRDFRVEAQVVARMEERIGAAGLDGGLGRELAELLINASLRMQNSIVDRSSGAGLQKVAVLGGRGNMGSWLCHFLRAQGHRVTVVDPAGPLEGFAYAEGLDGVLSGAEVVVLATPLGETSNILREVVDRGPEGVIVDVCSLKAPVLAQIRRAVKRGLRITSIHPMFSSTVGSLSGKNVVVCRCGSPEADAQARELFAGTGANLTEVSLEDHDELMAYVLGLGHAINIAFFTTLLRSGKHLTDLEGIAGYTFTRQAKLARDVAHENARLYYEIQALNPHTPQVLEACGEGLKEILAAARARREEDFISMMGSGRKYFAGGGLG